MSSLASPRPTRRELFDIHAICQWCVVSAVLMTLLATACVMRTLQADDAPGSAEPGR
jgi:hypothetical protein